MVGINTSWYLAVVLHYMGSDLWAVGFLKRSVTVHGITLGYDWVENLSFEDAQKLVEKERGHLTRTTAEALRVQLGSA